MGDLADELAEFSASAAKIQVMRERRGLMAIVQMTPLKLLFPDAVT